MTQTASEQYLAAPTGGQIKLRTLTTLRWVAIAGQIAAIMAGERFFALSLDLGLCSAVIALSVIANMVFQFTYPESKRLNTREATLMLVFDTVQLGALLGIAGGVNNPFALLIMAPVIVAATALTLKSTLIIGATAVLTVSFVTWIHVPLTTKSGEVLLLPEPFAVGYWLAIVVSIVFVAIYTRRVSLESQSMREALFATQMALSREQKLTDIGGVVAAAAHELGTPLATMKLVSSEMLSELEPGSELYEDAELIREQADRCRDILQSMGRTGKDDLHLHQAVLSAVIDEAAEPHQDRGKKIFVQTANGEPPGAGQPMVLRRPELIHGLRNLIQNAVDFATTTVWVELCWSDSRIAIRVIDDGAGFPPHLLGRIGDPFIRKGSRKERDAQRPEYEGMGLGLFIAKTLLERTGARLNFANGTDPFSGAPCPGEKCGAIIEVVWNRGDDRFEAKDRAPALGANRRLHVLQG